MPNTPSESTYPPNARIGLQETRSFCAHVFSDLERQRSKVEILWESLKSRLSDRDEVYCVSSSALAETNRVPKDPDAILEAYRDDTLWLIERILPEDQDVGKGIGPPDMRRELAYERRIKVGEHSGLEFAVREFCEPRAIAPCFRSRFRIFLVGRRLYAVEIFALADKDETESVDANQFFDSFRLRVAPLGK